MRHSFQETADGFAEHENGDKDVVCSIKNQMRLKLLRRITGRQNKRDKKNNKRK